MADRYVSFESLIMTGRVTTRRGKYVLVSTAGYNPSRYWMEFDNKKDAIRAGKSLELHIREKRKRKECNTDLMYNHIVLSWIEQLVEGGYVRQNKETPSGD